MGKGKVGFQLVDITTEEFAVIEDNFPSESNDIVGISYGTEVKANDELTLVGLFVKFQFTNNDQPFLICEIGCHFIIKAEDWKACTNPDSSITFKKGLLTHLLVLTVGTCRGVIHAKKPKALDGIVLPTFDVTKHFTEDVTLPLIQDEEEWV